MTKGIASLKTALLLCLLACGICANAHMEEFAIIPKPLKVERQEGFFRLTAKTIIGYEAGLQEQAAYLRDALAGATGWDLQLVESGKKGDIRLCINPEKAQEEPEGYLLEVTHKRVNISATDKGGAFYGIQTLLQLFPTEVYSPYRQSNISWQAPAVTVMDAPERPWRGMMLDVARYFFDKEFVKKYIDMMAMYKMNKLQFHLIDDSGWRLEIKKYPRLTEVGAWAGSNTHRLGGFYTQDDIKELVAYGAARNVEIIPEIEFPAHMLSAVVAYPWLSCTGLQHEVPMQHFISRDLLCVGKETSIRFLEDVLEETVSLFPSKYINIGGDEAVYDRWAQCPRCRAVMEREGLQKPAELQGYLTNVVAEMMKKKDRTIIGWEEIIMRGKVNNPVAALIWHNVADSIHATRSGHKAVLVPASHMYLDFPESSTPGEVKAATWMPPISLEKCYSMTINNYSPSSTVLGVQGALWSDQFIHGTLLQELPLLNENRSENYAEYLTFPRLLAVAEVGWCKMSARNYPDFLQRLSTHYARLDHKGCGYRVPEPEIVEMKPTADGMLEFTLAPSVEGSRIVYTTNGQYPTIHSEIYTAPVKVKNKSDFHAMTVVSNRRFSLPIHFAPDYSAYKQYGTFTTEWKPLQMQPVPSPWRFECTGKIAGNGTYEVTFIRTKGADALKLGTLQLFKRNEKLAEVVQSGVAGTSPVTYRFRVDAFEAGTPFFITVEACGEGGNDTSGLVFIRKVE